MTTVADILVQLQALAPLELAADWDNVGLLLGDRQAKAERVMTCLTVTPEVVAEAVEAKAELVVSHHPLLFRGVKRITAATPEGRMVLDLVRAGIAVYSPHTAWDNAPGGINELIARLLELTEVRPLLSVASAAQCKIVVFVPEQDFERVADAMFAAGAGHIGEYSQCSFRLAGTGTFFGSDAANPTVGQKGRREEVAELRLEALCPQEAVERVVSAMRRVHSYEEPAYDVYPLRPEPRRTSGVGRIGVLGQPQSLRSLAQLVQTQLQAAQVQMVGAAATAVHKVAVVCGSGGDLLPEAIRQQADVLLTGEMRFHDCLAARAQGICVLLPGHYASERVGMEELARLLATKFNVSIVWASRQESDPGQYLE